MASEGRRVVRMRGVQGHDAKAQNLGRPCAQRAERMPLTAAGRQRLNARLVGAALAHAAADADDAPVQQAADEGRGGRQLLHLLGKGLCQQGRVARRQQPAARRRRRAARMVQAYLVHAAAQAERIRHGVRIPGAAGQERLRPAGEAGFRLHPEPPDRLAPQRPAHQQERRGRALAPRLVGARHPVAAAGIQGVQAHEQKRLLRHGTASPLSVMGMRRTADGRRGCLSIRFHHTGSGRKRQGACPRRAQKMPGECGLTAGARRDTIKGSP